MIKFENKLNIKVSRAHDCGKTLKNIGKNKIGFNNSLQLYLAKKKKKEQDYNKLID